MDRILKQLNSELCEWWTRANADLHSARFHGPDAEDALREACNLVADATYKLAKAAKVSLAVERERAKQEVSDG